MTDLLLALKKRISYIQADKWGANGGPVVGLGDDVKFNSSTGKLTGTLEVRVPKRNGDMVLVKSRTLTGVASEQEIDDILAEMLSVVLSKHDQWPRR